jgi:hypothetical protein
MSKKILEDEEVTTGRRRRTWLQVNDNGKQKRFFARWPLAKL